MAKKKIDEVEVNGESIITALKIIKQVCEDNEESGCKKCPFGIVEGNSCTCGIIDIEPSNWKILEYTKFQALG